MTQRPQAASSSSAPSESVVASPVACVDSWTETDQHWIRLHPAPRHTFFAPFDTSHGPEPDVLQDLRTTHCVFDDGNRDTLQHNWRDPRYTKAKTRRRWTGRSIFMKRAAAPTDAASMEVSGNAVVPHTLPALKAHLSGLRPQLREAQQRDPRLHEIMQRLKGSRMGDYVAEARGAEGQKVHRRALKYRLASDGMLVARDEGEGSQEDRPVIPDAPHVEGIPGTPKTMTWKHLMLGAVHNTVTGNHRNAQEMCDELRRLVAWWPPEHLARDCKTWRERCKLCTSVFQKPRHECQFQAVHSARPFARMQFDLLEIKPSGPEGQKYVLTVICVATRYIFLRVLCNREAPEVASAVLDVILDAGVVPTVLQSDNEFMNLAFEELCSLLGSNQIFSTALRPQTQGIVERSHRDIRANLALLVEAYVRSNPRRWPEFLRFVEHKLRHKSITEGFTPYSAVHGFYGSSSLCTALGAISEIPTELVHQDWLRSIIEEARLINASLSDHWVAAAELRSRKHGEKKKEPDLSIGDLVLLTKPFWEQGLGVILPQCDGPYSIYKFPTGHTAQLIEPLSGEPALQGKPVALSRLLKFHFPASWAGPEHQDIEVNKCIISELKVGCFVCVSPRTSTFSRIYVSRVERTFPGQDMAEVTLYWVPPGNRCGPWQARVWEVWQDKGVVKKEVVGANEILCIVQLQNGALTPSSLEALAVCGVPTAQQPRLDSTLPPVR